VYEPIVFILFAMIVLAAVYFYVQRRKGQGAFGGSTAQHPETTDDQKPG
jgi:hypothetical protein